MLQIVIAVVITLIVTAVLTYFITTAYHKNVANAKIGNGKIEHVRLSMKR